MNCKTTERAWYVTWDVILQEQIQQWISVISYHIQEIIRLEGSNEYKKDVRGFKRSWTGTRVKDKLLKLQFIDQKTQHQIEDRENNDDESYSDVESDVENEEE